MSKPILTGGANDRPSSPWPRLDAELRRLWAENVVTRQIGAQLGVTKNAVIGRARRLQLPARPSPIQAQGQGQRLVDGKPVKRARPSRAKAAVEAVAEALQPAIALRPLFVEDHEPMRCRWPMWANHERAGRPQRFCTAARQEGESYCCQHRALVYQRVVWIEDEAEPLGEAA